MEKGGEEYEKVLTAVDFKILLLLIYFLCLVWKGGQMVKRKRVFVRRIVKIIKEGKSERLGGGERGLKVEQKACIN